jgi:hypothetical protein
MSNEEINTSLNEEKLTDNTEPQSDIDIDNIDNMDNMDKDLKTAYEKLDCKDDKYYSSDCNKFLLKKELLEKEYLSEHPETDAYLYPSLSDSNFNEKIASKKEFNDTQYDGEVHSNIKEHADLLAKADYELQPHQMFVKNFLSSNTPYNSLLLYHGLGTGKTCSAIGVCEEMRDYMRQMGITKRIIIVASENVQDNFKLQLFDERKLKLVDGIWNIKGCTGNKLLKEINPTNLKGLSKEKVINQIKNLINTYYIFLGYGQFANYIIKTLNYSEEMERARKSEKERPEKRKIQMLKDIKVTLNKRIINRLRAEFNNRLIVIDEVHNIRKAEDNENKKVAINLELLVKSVENMRLVLLSATPMYNSYKEIIWLLNLMNTNDRRGRIEVKDVFAKDGEFKKGGEELLIRKATGYVSFVRGENPYTFPYRVYPNDFAKENTFPYIKYPSYQMNLKKIPQEDKKRILSIYLNKIGNCENCGKCQYCCYKYIIHSLRNKKFSVTTNKGVVRDMPSFENMESFGYTLLQTPLESLIISYPIPGLKDMLDDLPEEQYSNEFMPRFSEEVPIEEEVKEKPGFMDEEAEKEVENEDENNNAKKANIVEEEDKQEEEKEQDTTTKRFRCPKGQIQKPPKSKICVPKNSQKGGSIDPYDLTGKNGIERMMDFVDEKSPPIKGDYEYKKSTLNNYGRIFSHEKIGAFSSKIKCILDKIYDHEKNKVSEGIILIYSKYIDSGLIPMALALEEMGFTRYGENVKPLFKKNPSDVVDVRTMHKPTDKKNFIPARYSMITGDPRLSPNNDFEVKGLTDEKNVDGSKVKVVLISKAGSEGIDFKYIRQVHILEPWYNMNRIEQIIGRGVRNFSHKDLPFEKRNVQIFMYGTILGDNEEEAADLYVYRVAEYKAVQIGNITRILKETAVDCIINHEQTNFTQKNINKILEEPIEQELSNGNIIKNFKVGDMPFSPACDYMATCEYSCRPVDKIDPKNINEDTYNENFILSDSDKIMQRIRMLMKESFFYKKDVLLNAIRASKEYPYIQIYAALTQLIEDKNEFIVDRYGRNGRLVNIGEYYLFQPIELSDKHISVFDRSVPIDYKHDYVNFEIKKEVLKQPIIAKEKQRVEVEVSEKQRQQTQQTQQTPQTQQTQQTPQINMEGKKVLDEIIANMDVSKEFSKQTKVPRGDDDWYKHSGIVMKKMAIEYPESKTYLINILISHMIDLLLFEEKLALMDYLYSLEHIAENSVEWFAKEYFERNSIKTSNIEAIILYKLNKRMIMILDETGKWIEATPEDQREIANTKEAKNMLTFNVNDYNKLVGFIGYEKKNKYMVFKTKDLLAKRDTGARCDEAGKDKTMKKLNEIIRENKYTNETTKAQKDTDGTVIKEAVGQTELCVMQEFILRYFDFIQKDGKKWFLTPEMAIFFKLYTIFT